MHKKKSRDRVAHPESGKPRGLRLTVDTLRTLSSADLTQAVSGCDTGSLTTEQTQNYSALCTTDKCL